jgi:hypothetical protein
MSYDPSKSSWQATPNTDYMSATSQSSSMACDRIDLILKTNFLSESSDWLPK